MSPFDLFRSFNPALNPIGFGASDFLELFLAFAVGLSALVAAPYLLPWGARLARRRWVAMAAVATLTVALRLLLLPHHPVPTPDIADEFSHLLVADTLLHGRLANPAHPMHRFFETFFVLQTPSYSSIYPVGQGLVLAIGKLLTGTAWGGVVLATAAFCALSYWMLRGWTSPGWALVGGLLSVVEFGPLCLWMNDYWGGSAAAAAGCLVFGALPRIQRSPDSKLPPMALGMGLAVHSLIRPFESIFLAASVIWWIAPKGGRLLKPAAIAAAFLVPAIAVTLIQNQTVTGNWRVFPYAASQYQYGVPISLTFQKNPIPHNDLTPEQKVEYAIQAAFKPARGETFGTYLARLIYRVHFYRFFFAPPLYLAFVAWLLHPRGNEYRWMAGTLLLFTLGLNFFPAFQFHYFAAVGCLFLLASIEGLRRISGVSFRRMPVGAEAGRWILALCAVHFVFWYGLHLLEGGEFTRPLLRYDTWDLINHGNPERRIAIAQRIAREPGKLLVFVRYYPNHIAQDEWVWNGAAIDGSRVVWARDRGDEEDAQLEAYYPDRKALLLEPDFRPLPKLGPYLAKRTEAPPAPEQPKTASPFEEPPEAK